MSSEARQDLLPNAVLIMVALIAAEFTASFELSMVYASFPALVRHFGNSVDVGWVVTANMLVAAGMAAVAGRLGDIYGRRRLMLIMLAIAGTGSAISACSDHLGWLILGRSLNGAVGAVLPLCFGLVRESLPPRLVALGVGVVTAAAGIAFGVGLLVGGLIVDNGAWQMVFVTAAAMALIAITAVGLLVPATRPPGISGRLDYVGGILFLAAISGLLLVLSNVRTWGWWDLRTIWLMAGSILVLAVWVVHSLRHAQPLINIRLFAIREVLIGNICMALVALAAMQTTQVLMLLLQQPRWTGVGLGASATMAATFQLPANITTLLVAPLSGYLIGRFGGRRIMIAGALILIMSWFLLAVDHGSLGVVIALGCVCNLGLVTLYTAMFSIVVATVPQDRTSEAAGMLAVTRATFMGAGAQLLVVLLASSTVGTAGTAAGIFPSEAAYVLTFGSICAVCAVVLAVAIWLPGDRGAANAGPIKQEG